MFETVAVVLFLAASVLAAIGLFLLRRYAVNRGVSSPPVTIATPPKDVAPPARYPIPEGQGVRMCREDFTLGHRVAYWSAPQSRWVWTKVVGWTDHRRRHLILQADHRAPGDVFKTRYTNRRLWLIIA